jgi:hypothetical protein
MLTTRNQSPIQKGRPGKPAPNWKWRILGLVGLAVAVAFLVYAPALRGPFVFDDRALRYAKPALVDQSLYYWIYSLRPMLFLNFWLNHMILGDEPLGYHIGNVLIHLLNGTLAFLIVYKLLGLYRPAAEPLRRQLLAGFAAAVFLLHPLQTESVAYIASRSETLCAFFMLGALTLFVYRLPGSVTWPVSLGILLLFLAACATKEQAPTLIPALLLVDFCWNPGLSLAGIRKNWRVYVLLGGTGIIAVGAALRILARSVSAGFGLRDLTWWQYFLTECRVWFAYLRLLLWPTGLSVDHDVPISQGLLDRGSLFGLIAILAIAGLAIYFLRRYRLACFGVLLFLILLAPTSSFAPLRDPFVEHRLYLPILALTLIPLEAMVRLRGRYQQVVAACLALLAAYGVASYRRNRLWGNSIELWRDAVRKAPGKARPYAQLAIEYVAEHRCGDAAGLLKDAPQRVHSDANLLTIWGKADECLDRFQEAESLLSKAAQLKPTALVYVELGLVQAKQGKAQQAYEAFCRGIQLDPSEKVSYIYRARWYEAAGQYELAAGDYRRALALSPNNRVLRKLLANVQARLHFGGGGLGTPPVTDPTEEILQK